MKEIYWDRRKRLAREIGEDAILFVPGAKKVYRNADTEYPFRQDSDFYYLTGYTEPGCLLIVRGKDRAATLIVPERDQKMVTWYGAPLSDVAIHQQTGIGDIRGLDKKGVAAFLAQEVAEARTIYMPSANCYERNAAKYLRQTVCGLASRYPSGRDIRDSHYLIGEMRLFKDERELAVIEKAAQISSDVHRWLVDFIAPGISERELAAEIGCRFVKRGGDPLHAYPPIVAFGDNACTLHHLPTDRVLRAGELALVDAGCEFEGYASDITRTYAATGVFTPEQKTLYEIVLAAQEEAIRYARRGSTLALVHAAAAWEISRGLEALRIITDLPSQWLERKSFLPYFPHGTSHWMGIDVHDAGNYRRDAAMHSQRVLEPGMIFTVEPGIYIPPGAPGVDPKWHGIGIRIEDDILITERGYRNLTSGAPKALHHIEPKSFPF